GERFLRRAFASFGPRDAIMWFEQRGVRLKVEPDGRIFPISDSSATVIDLLVKKAEELGVVVERGCGVDRIVPHPDRLDIVLHDLRVINADRVIVCTGGHPKDEGFRWLAELGHRIIAPVPSLFTFNLPDDPIRTLSGVVAEHVRVRLPGSHVETTGPLLVTHWGMSGPAILRASAWGARFLHGLHYRTTVQVNWVGGANEQDVRSAFATQNADDAQKHAENTARMDLPKRLWVHLLTKAGIDPARRWGTIGMKDRNRLIDLLTNDRYTMGGKTTFKEEFVTAGGVDLGQVDPRTMCSTVVPGLYFAGEVLDIDGITGGFNFQAAWTTGHIAGRLL
ncbi:MAG: aminoacetone oxidase family FAD-binding enzyme, partial [Flavobacteriales bacterium]|nr:aminoacetone oxidase family FAD-binding enzyme [Flavobacteriales bacterium]